MISIPAKVFGRIRTATSFLEQTTGKNALFYLIFISLVLKFFLLLKCEVISNDGPTYISQAIQILEGEFWSEARSDVTIIYALLIAISSRMIGDFLLSAQLISLLASILTIIPLYLLIRDIWNPLNAFLSCLLFVLLPVFNEFAVDVMRDPLFLLGFTTMVLFAWRALDQGKKRYMLGAFILVLITPFFRLEAVVFFPFFLVALITVAICEPSRRWRFAIFSASLLVLILAGVFYVSAGGVGRHTVTAGQMFEGLKKFDFWQYPPELNEKLSSLSDELPRMGYQNNLIEIVRGNIRLIYLLGMAQMFIKQVTWPGVLLLLWGVVRPWRLTKGKLYFLGVAAVFTLMAFDFQLRFGFLTQRYFYIPLLMSLPWMACGMERLLSTAKNRKSTSLYAAGLIILLALTGQTVRDRLAPQPVSAKMAGEWIREQEEFREVLLLSNERKIPYYAGKRTNFACYEFAPLEMLVEYASEPGEKLVSILTRLSSLSDVPVLPGYVLVAKFEDERYASMVFARK